MVKIGILFIIILLMMKLIKDEKIKKYFLYGHIGLSCLLASYGIIHGMHYFLTASTMKKISGILILIVLLSEMLLGIFVMKNKGKKIHGILGIILICFIVLHVII